jgi:hypothetical protein
MCNLGVNWIRTTVAESISTKLSLPKARSETLLALQAANNATEHSSTIQTRVTVWRDRMRVWSEFSEAASTGIRNALSLSLRLFI